MCATPIFFLTHPDGLWPELMALLQPFRYHVEKVRGGTELMLCGMADGPCLCAGKKLEVHLERIATEALDKCVFVSYWPTDIQDCLEAAYATADTAFARYPPSMATPPVQVILRKGKEQCGPAPTWPLEPRTHPYIREVVGVRRWHDRAVLLTRLLKEGRSVHYKGLYFMELGTQEQVLVRTLAGCGHFRRYPDVVPLTVYNRLPSEISRCGRERIFLRLLSAVNQDAVYPYAYPQEWKKLLPPDTFWRRCRAWWASLSGQHR